MLKSELTSKFSLDSSPDSRPPQSELLSDAPFRSSSENVTSTSEGQQQIREHPSHPSHPPAESTPVRDSVSLPSSIEVPPRVLDSHALLQHNLAIHEANTQQRPSHESIDPNGGLHIRTDVVPQISSGGPVLIQDEAPLRHSISSTSLPRRTPSIRAALAATHSNAGSLSPGSGFSSPQLAAMADITPLPSPIGLGPSPWKSGRTGQRSRTSSTTSRPDSLSAFKLGDSAPGQTSPPKKRMYHGLRPPTPEMHNINTQAVRENEVASHAQNRSLSEYVPEAIQVPKQRNATVSGPSATLQSPSTNVPLTQPKLHREEYLAVQRGIAAPNSRPPTPPRSAQSGWESSSDEKLVEESPTPKTRKAELYSVSSLNSRRPQRYRVLRQLGQGTFSKVMLAVKESIVQDEYSGDYVTGGGDITGVREKSKKLVAVKVVQHGPAGGADTERVETSLAREIEILKSIDHPSLVHLMAFENQEKRSLLILTYCHGGDMFEVASLKHEFLVPSLIRRIFSELVDAVRYLHSMYIVHRDIKLENLLLNLPTSLLPEIEDWQTYDCPVVTLTDLGLSRRIPRPPESPLLHTRCGSEDYAAPELLMGQPYDGRATDAWALGVLLYSIMERRLPFDPLPGARGDPAKLRARTPHRIARCEWSWFVYGDEDGEWDPLKAISLEGARACVEGLLKRATRRKSLDDIAQMEWVRKGIQVPQGLKRIEEED